MACRGTPCAITSAFQLTTFRREDMAMQCLTAATDRSDHSLVDLSRQGDDDAFGELLSRHYRRCIDLATMYLRNHWDAEDQVQIAMSKAHARLHQYQGEAEFATWLSRIVVNQCLMFLRETRRARFVYLDDCSREPDGPPMELPACGPDPEGELALGELKQMLRREIGHVPPLFRKVMMLRDVQELPMMEVAEALRITVPAAKSRLLRARTELRNRMKQRCDTNGTLSPLSRSAAPLDRVARHRTMQPVPIGA
jgi:RNA polymerase sigma-70 factor, ECF subfamily